MSDTNPQGAPEFPTEAQLKQASQWFLRVRSEAARVDDLAALKDWLERDLNNKVAYRQVAGTWTALGKVSSAPEVMIGRRDALDDAHRAIRRRWATERGWSRYATLAASVTFAVIAAVMWIYFQRGVYETDLGERRALTLEDGSTVSLDANSRVRVRYDHDQRMVYLLRGQARFDVAKDAGRPFRVRVGGQTVVALGTQFNVDLLDGNVLVSMIEGHVAVTGINVPVGRQREESSSGQLAKSNASGSRNGKRGAASPMPAIELKTGEGLRVLADSEAVVLPQIDIHRAVAWQDGKMYFDNEPLVSAAERMNRYSQLQIIVDPAVAVLGVSGVFNAGDSNAFVEAISAYFPVQVDHVNASRVRLIASN